MGLGVPVFDRFSLKVNWKINTISVYEGNQDEDHPSDDADSVGGAFSDGVCRRLTKPFLLLFFNVKPKTIILPYSLVTAQVKSEKCSSS